MEEVFFALPLPPPAGGGASVEQIVAVAADVAEGAAAIALEAIKGEVGTAAGAGLGDGEFHTAGRLKMY